MLNWKLIKKSLRYKDMRNKILAVFGIILIYRFLASVPVPLGDPVALRDALQQLFENQDVLSLFDAFSGGALSNFSIVALGLGPYINASIIMQLVTKTVPALEEMQKEGEDGRRKINQITRVLSVPFALAQSIALIITLDRSVISSATGESFVGNASNFEWALVIFALTAGSVLMMWLGEILSEQKLGNGITLLIVAGIAASLPSTINTFINAFRQGWGTEYSVLGLFTAPFNVTTYLIVISIIAAIVGGIYFVIKISEAYRIITISYAKRVQGSKAYGGVDSIMPIKLLLAGVIPIIFAYTFMTAPMLVSTMLDGSSNDTLQSISTTISTFFNPENGPVLDWSNLSVVQNLREIGRAMVYPGVYFSLVMAFTYFYTNLQFNSEETADDLQKRGGFIAGVRPGENTRKYLSKVVNRLTLFGGLSLATLSVIPIIAGWYIGDIAQLALSATTLIIIVSGSLETMRQVESNALVVTYDEQ